MLTGVYQYINLQYHQSHVSFDSLWQVTMTQQNITDIVHSNVGHNNRIILMHIYEYLTEKSLEHPEKNIQGKKRLQLQ